MYMWKVSSGSSTELFPVDIFPNRTYDLWTLLIKGTSNVA